MLTEHEEMFLWDSVLLLQQQHHDEHAKAVFKSIVEKPFVLLRHSTDVLENMTFDLSTVEYLKELRMYSSRIQSCVKEWKIELATELFVEYLRVLSKLLSKDQSEEAFTKLLARLLVGQARTILAEKGDALSTSQAAELLGVSDQTVRRMIEKGKFPDAFQTEGGHWRIPQSYFKVDLETGQKADAFMRRIDQKNEEAGEVDEFDLT